MSTYIVRYPLRKICTCIDVGTYLILVPTYKLSYIFQYKFKFVSSMLGLASFEVSDVCFKAFK